MTKTVASRESRPLTAMVTGASEGIGADCARLLARCGAHVALVDIDKVPLARLANAIGAHAFACDVLSEHSVNQLVQNLSEALPPIDLLINVAGKGYVRALGMMRVSRTFADAAAGAPMTIINIAAPGGTVQPFAFAGSAKAFCRLSEGLGAALGARGIEVMTLDSPDSAAEVNEIITTWCRAAPAALPAEPRRASR